MFNITRFVLFSLFLHETKIKVIELFYLIMSEYFIEQLKDNKTTQNIVLDKTDHELKENIDVMNV